MPIDVGGWRIRNEVSIRIMAKCRHKPVANLNYFLSQVMPWCFCPVNLLITVLCVTILIFEVIRDSIIQCIIGLCKFGNLQNLAILPVHVLHSLIEWSVYECNNKRSSHLKLIVTVYSLLMASSVNSLLLLISGVHPNPGPSLNKAKRFSFGVWNLDSLPSRNFSKIPLVEGLQNMHDFDIFGLCETYLNDEHTMEDIQIKGFSDKPLRSDSKLANVQKQGGVALYYKSDLPIRERKELNTLDECIVSEITLKNEKMFFVLLYRSPSKTV